MQLWPSGNRMMWLSARASPWRLTWWDPKWGLVEREDMVPGLFCSSSHHHLPPLCPEARTRYYQRSTLVYGASLPLQWARRGMLPTGVTLGNQLKRLRGLNTALVSYHLFVVFVPWCIAYLYHYIFVFVSLWDGSKILSAFDLIPPPPELQSRIRGPPHEQTKHLHFSFQPAIFYWNIMVFDNVVKKCYSGSGHFTLIQISETKKTETIPPPAKLVVFCDFSNG